MIITLNKHTTPDGCIMPLTKPVIDEALRVSDGFQGPYRFTVIVDEETHTFDDTNNLDEFLGCIRIGSKCSVFRNFGGGASISIN